MPLPKRSYTDKVPPKHGFTSVTVHDVALMAGVSAMTVSRAVNTPGSLPEATLGKVQRAIAKTGYVPNLLAGPVSLGERGYQLMLGQSGYAESREDDLLSASIGRRPDGIVLTGVTHSDGRGAD